MRVGLIALGSAVAVALAGIGWGVVRLAQRWEPAGRGVAKSDLRPRAGQVSVETAIRSCEIFFKKAGLPAPTEVPRVKRTAVEPPPGSGIYSVWYGSKSYLDVDLETGEVCGFSNSEKDAGRPAGGATRGAPKLVDALGAQIYLKNLAKRLGAGDRYKLVDFEYGYVSPRHHRRSGRGPTTSASFEPKPYGYRLQRPFDAYAMTVDITDGILVGYARTGPIPFEIESHDAVLKQSEARALANAVTVKYPVRQMHRVQHKDVDVGPGGVAPPKPSYLGYVLPNGGFDGVKYSGRPYRLRLAWVMGYPGGDEVWIDAGDGKVLGGIRHGYGMYK